MESKPRMPVPRPSVDVNGITVVLDADMGRYSNGYGHMAADCTEVDIYAGPEEEDNRIGQVRAALGGGVSVIVKAAEHTRIWFIPALSLWNLVEEADRQYLLQQSEE